MLRTEHELRVDLGLVQAAIAAVESRWCRATLALHFGEGRDTWQREIMLPLTLTDPSGLLDFLRKQEGDLRDALVDAAAGKPAP
jgi:hypothetical protein